MTKFESLLDPAEFEESWASHRQVLHSSVTVEQTGFYTQVTLLHDGRNLFLMGGITHANVPLVGFVRFSRESFTAIRSGEEAVVGLGCSGTLRLRREGSQVWVSVSGGGAPVAIDHQELVAAILRFADEARALIVARVPELQSHPCWPTWFPTTTA